MPHEQLKLQYAKDAEISTTPHLAWQVKHDNTAWETCHVTPKWYEHNQYRRHPHADLILTYDSRNVYEWSKQGMPWRTVLNPPLWNVNLNYRKKPMAHETLKAQYAKDAETYNEPYLLWEYNHRGWHTMEQDPCWDDRIRYRRKPEARPHAHLIKLWADGAEIQKLNHDNWVPCPNPCWESTGVYRQKPAVQTRWIGVYRMPAKSVYIAEGKISREDCKPAEGDTLIKLLEVTINDDNSTTTKEHKCEI